MAVCREIWFWPMRCKAHATYPGIQLSNGLLILRTTGPLVHSTCSGNFISWRKSTCATAARKLVGSWKTGDSFSKQLQTTIRRSLAGSTGLRRNGSWKHSSNPKDWVGMIRGCKASTLNITTSIHFAGYSLLSRLASELRSGTTMYGVPVQHMFRQLIRVRPVGLGRCLAGVRSSTEVDHHRAGGFNVVKAD